MSQPKVVEKWCQIAKQYLKKARVIKQIGSLKKRLQQAKPHEIESIFQQSDSTIKPERNFISQQQQMCPSISWHRPVT